MRVTARSKSSDQEYEVTLAPDGEHKVQTVIRKGEAESFRTVKLRSPMWKRAVEAAQAVMADDAVPEEPAAELPEASSDDTDVEPADQPIAADQPIVEREPCTKVAEDAKPLDPHESLVVRFENEHHHNLHRVLLDAGFTFEVTNLLQVGRRYTHPKKPIEVLLEEDPEDREDFLDCKVFFQGKVQVDRDYSKAEWEWFTGQPDTPDGVVEALRRELHILINVRPHYMRGSPSINVLS
jgi:hypothetical protein